MFRLTVLEISGHGGSIAFVPVDSKHGIVGEGSGGIVSPQIRESRGWLGHIPGHTPPFPNSFDPAPVQS